MRTIVNIIQTIGVSFMFVVFLRLVSFLRKVWLKTAIKTREKYNKKHGLHPENGVAEIDTTSLSYQIDSLEGTSVAVALFLVGLLLTLFVPIQNDNLFCLITTILSIIVFLCCWFMRNLGTKKYRVLVYIFCGVSLLLIAHFIVSLILDIVVLFEYSNSVNALLYIWGTMIIYKLLLDRNQ